MDKLDVQTTQQLFTTKGAWRNDCYSSCIVDLKEAISDGGDPPLCNDLICMASRLADKNEKIEVRGFIRKMTDANLLRSHSEHFLTNIGNMDRTKRSAIFKRIGKLFFMKYVTGAERNPFNLIKAALVKCTPGLAVNKKKIIKNEKSKESSDDANSSSSESSDSDNNSKSSSSVQEANKNSISPEQRNIMVCLLMRFIHGKNQCRGTAIGKIIAAMAIEGVLDPQTIEYTIHMNSILLTKKVMGQLIKISNKLSTPAFVTAVMHGFETERGGRLETLISLAKRDDLPDKGSILIGQLLARTGMLVEDKRRAFTQIEVRALLSGIEADSRKEKVQEAHKIEMLELSKLSMMPAVIAKSVNNDKN
jgi:hypothetical protein